MSLTKETIMDKYEIVGDFKAIQIRSVNIIKENGVEIQRGGYHRHVIMPNDDVSGEPAEIQAIAAVVHTQEIKDAYAAHLASNQPTSETE